MKKTIYLLLVFAGISMGVQAQANKQVQANRQVQAKQTRSSDEKQVAAAVETLRAAMVSGNRSQLQAIASPNLTYGHSSGLMEDKAAFVEALASGKSDFVTIELTDQTIKFDGADVALVRHNLSAQTNNGGKPGSTKLGVLTVWRKQQGNWKLLARQAFKL